jgi:hypothetical protein
LTETGCSIELPKDTVGSNDTDTIQRISCQLWNLEIDDQRVALMVLTQFCDALVWWTQRYKKPSGQREN